MKVVFDANVVVAGVGWQGEGWLCFTKMAKRQAFAYGTEETLRETREIVLRLIKDRKPRHNATARLNWFLERVRLVAPYDIGKGRSRDPKDDPYIAAALASRSEAIVTYDRDLLILGKPFGFKIVRPSAFLQMLKY